MKRKTPLIIIADMGATFSRVASIDEYQAIRRVETYPSAQYNSPKDVICAYLNDIGESDPEHVLIAVATPVKNDHLVLTNNHWDFSQSDIAQKLNTKVTFINDFEALSLALDHLPLSDTLLIQTSSASLPQSMPTANNYILPKVVIGTGTGFGTAMSLPTDSGAISIPSEGGHALYSPQDSIEIQIVDLAMQECQHPIIVEDLLGCKEGIPRLIRIMAQLNESTPSFDATPTALLQAALEIEDPFAIEVLNRYCAMLGNVASDIALTTGAFGGIYIGGGFTPRFSDFLLASPFRDCFLNKVSVNALLSETPTYLITHPYPALVGLQQILHRYL